MLSAVSLSTAVVVKLVRMLNLEARSCRCRPWKTGEGTRLTSATHPAAASASESARQWSRNDGTHSAKALQISAYSILARAHVHFFAVRSWQTGIFRARTSVWLQLCYVQLACPSAQRCKWPQPIRLTKALKRKERLREPAAKGGITQ